MLYILPQAQERLQFLLEEYRTLQTLDREFKRKAWLTDLTKVLKDFLAL